MKAKSNPFRSDQVDKFRYRLEGTDWSSLYSRFKHHGRRGAVVGPHGTGKTVWMEDFRQHLEIQDIPTAWIGFQDGFNQQDARRLRIALHHLGPDQILFLDGWEWVPRWTRRNVYSVFHSRPGLLLSAHRPTRLPTLWATRPQPEIAQSMAETFLARSLTPSEESQLQTAFSTHQGNLREVMRTFYLHFAQT